ncbi:MAG: cell division protein FtsW [Alphaproteobacteria bacterium]|nr:cell division protein FtsW [Alphaproteobacteria bacterium]|tara:strand:- start:90 stop:1229 length:1140 start_codon:yes stop_codon:yes gene_type:complete
MIFIARNDKSILSRWWWSIDHWNLIQILILAAIGSIMILAAGSAVAVRNNLPELHFFIHHIYYLIISMFAMIISSFLSNKGIIRISIIGFMISILLLFLVMIFGPDIKGASRWLIIGNVSMQPSEFIKPFFVVITAYLISQQFNETKFLPKLITRLHISLLLLITILFFLFKQPDLGMSVIIILIWSGQIFLAGISLRWFLLLFSLLGCGILFGYNIFPHVKRRIDCFLNSPCEGMEQITNSFTAYESGGLLGNGPGDGIIKNKISDAHTDFIFPVIAEEFGAIFCIIILLLTCSIVIRGLIRVYEKNDLFSLLSVGGLLILFGIQVLLNVSVTLGIVPTTGITFPFISYGGSSLLSISISMGIVLALTKNYSGKKYEK